MGGGIAEVAGKKHLRGVEQRAILLFRTVEQAEKSPECLELLVFITAQLLDLGRILAMVRRVVVIDLKAAHVFLSVAAKTQHDDPRRVGLERQVDQG